MLWSSLQDGRKDWMIFILEKLNGAPLDFFATEYQPIMLLSKKLQDGSDLLGFFNLGFDTLNEVELKCASIVKQVEILTPSGKWEKIDFKFDNNLLSFAARIECYSNIVFRIDSK